jgi:hypothetical protein
MHSPRRIWLKHWKLSQPGGVLVQGVVEASQAVGPASVYCELQQAGIDVRLDGNPANMHHKFIVIDEEICDQWIL